MGIAENYVSFETAKLLKKKGFDGEIHTTFDKEGYTQQSITIQTAMKWLRESYEIDIITSPHRRKKKTYYSKILKNFYLEHMQLCNTYSTYEKSCEAAIKYCLNNLI